MSCAAGKNALHYCNSAGKCVDVSCQDFCAATAGTSTGKCSTLGAFCTCGTVTPVP